MILFKLGKFLHCLILTPFLNATALSLLPRSHPTQFCFAFLPDFSKFTALICAALALCVCFFFVCVTTCAMLLSTGADREAFFWCEINFQVHFPWTLKAGVRIVIFFRGL